MVFRKRFVDRWVECNVNRKVVLDAWQNQNDYAPLLEWSCFPGAEHNTEKFYLTLIFTEAPIEFAFDV